MSFGDYEIELLEALAGIDSDLSAGRIDAARSKSRKAASLLQSLRLEARTAPAGEKEACAIKLKAHEAAISDANRRIEGASSSALLSGSKSGGSGESEATRDAKARAAATTAKLAQGTDQLKAAQKTLDETIGVAEATTADLQSQREKLESIRKHTGEVNADMDEAREITNRMSRGFWGSLIGSITGK
jgi:chromosome segregation ATPase